MINPEDIVKYLNLPEDELDETKDKLNIFFNINTDKKYSYVKTSEISNYNNYKNFKSLIIDTDDNIDFINRNFVENIDIKILDYDLSSFKNLKKVINYSGQNLPNKVQYLELNDEFNSELKEIKTLLSLKVGLNFNSNLNLNDTLEILEINSTVYNKKLNIPESLVELKFRFDCPFNMNLNINMISKLYLPNIFNSKINYSDNIRVLSLGENFSQRIPRLQELEVLISNNLVEINLNNFPSLYELEMGLRTNGNFPKTLRKLKILNFDKEIFCNKNLETLDLGNNFNGNIYIHHNINTLFLDRRFSGKIYFPKVVKFEILKQLMLYSSLELLSEFNILKNEEKEQQEEEDQDTEIEDED